MIILLHTGEAAGIDGLLVFEGHDLDTQELDEKGGCPRVRAMAR